MLNVRSAEGPGEQVSTPTGTAFTRAAERILHAALQLFADLGYEATSVRRIADESGVSPALVMHHYGSKPALRDACDRYALERVRATLQDIVSVERRAGPSVGWLDLVARIDEAMATVVRYTARRVVDGSEAGDALVDEIVAAVVESQTDAVEAGLMVRSDDPLMRAVLLTVYDIAPVVLARHVARLTGSDPRRPDGIARAARETLAMYARPMFGTPGDADHA